MDVKSLKRESVTTGRGIDGCWRQAKPALNIMNGRGLFLAKNAKVLPDGQKSRRSEPRHLGSYNFNERGFGVLSAPNAEVWLQVYGFSPVKAGFDVFRPISRPEGFDFSPVTWNTGIKNIGGRKREGGISTTDEHR
jgi:hypothetical protein